MSKQFHRDDNAHFVAFGNFDKKPHQSRTQNPISHSTSHNTHITPVPSYTSGALYLSMEFTTYALTTSMILMQDNMCDFDNLVTEQHDMLALLRDRSMALGNDEEQRAMAKQEIKRIEAISYDAITSWHCVKACLRQTRATLTHITRMDNQLKK